MLDTISQIFTAMMDLIPTETTGDFLVYLAQVCGYFLLFTMVTYWLHRLAHSWKPLWYFHSSHHEVLYQGDLEFSWWNVVGWFNSWRATMDAWLTEFAPMIIMIIIWPAAWPMGVVFYIDNMLSEGLTDHNPRLDIPGLAMGRHHIRHHKDMSVNFDIYFRLWDRVFGTYSNAK